MNLLNGADVQKLVQMAQHTAEIDGKELTDEDLQAILDWATGVASDHACLENVLNGRFRIRWAGDQPSFSLTEKGTDEAKDLIRNVGGDPDNPSLEDIDRV